MDPLRRLTASRYIVYGAGLILFMSLMGGTCRRRSSDRGSRGCAAACRRVRLRPEDKKPSEGEIPSITLLIGFPTPQTNLLAIDDETVYMATASGRIESALYGSTRTGTDSRGRIVPRFHAGLDIAPLERDRRGRPRDSIFAIADGTVAYANTIGGNSSYGRYIVIRHDDAVGPIYSLYAHLASVAASATAGQLVKRGETIGTMGNSSTMNIPMARAHLHLEICMMMNRRFKSWCEKEGLDTRHGIHHGWNFNAIDPLALYRAADQQFSMLEHMRQLAPAFWLVVNSPRPIDYFGIYPALWKGEGAASGTVVLAVCEGGTIIDGRPASEEDRALLAGGRQHAVLSVNTDVLGRNGRRLITRRGNNWQLGPLGERWLSILLH